MAVDELEEITDDSDFEENAEREVLMHNIIAEVNVVHPINYDIYDLCDMYKQKKLSVFKVAMLKEICEHFELSFKSKDKKQAVIDIISSMVKQCTCCEDEVNQL